MPLRDGAERTLVAASSGVEEFQLLHAGLRRDGHPYQLRPPPEAKLIADEAAARSGLCPAQRLWQKSRRRAH
jgi:hypothetical protein